MDIFAQLATNIIQEQETIIGPVALEQAQKVSGLTIDQTTKAVKLEGNKTTVIEELVEKYRDLFGQASVEVCRDAVKNLLSDIPKDQVPPILAS